MTDHASLLDGYKRFYSKHFLGVERPYDKLADGQNPRTLVIACSDSRVDPSIVTDSGPGDIFVIRNVANLVPPYQPDEATYHGTSAAVEFAITGINVEHVVVMGHSGCAGVNALLNPQEYQAPAEDEPSFVAHWVDIGYPARDRAAIRFEQEGTSEHGHTLNCLCEREVVRTSLDNLLTFPWLQRRVTSGDLTLHGWYFDVRSGELFVLDDESERFEKIFIKV
jgi:carbonic anhydrase